MKKILIIAVVLCGLALMGAQGWAEEPHHESIIKNNEVGYYVDPQWLIDESRLEKLPNNQVSCAARWQVLWPWAKKGNLEARAWIFFYLTTGSMILPGSSADFFSSIRDWYIMAVHSIGSKSTEPSIFERLNQFYLEMVRMKVHGSEKFIECAKAAWSHSCAKVAIEEHMVPTFENFAERIDFLLKHGEKIICTPDLTFSINDSAINKGEKK